VNGEVLGSGNPTIGGQQFKLKKKPLTYVPANNDVGRTSTLKVAVDGVLWREVGSFFNCGSQSQVYTVRPDDDQNTIITFGDGVSGARLPAGVGNVIASYRFGSGAAAPPAGAIQQIARSVIGLRAVRSPVQAFPGKDPDTADQIRQAAPRTALLFKRLVSIDDFQGYASFYAGVVKASAEFVWNQDRQQPGVAVTVIGNVDVAKLRTALIGLAEQSLIITVTQAVAIPMDLNLNVEIDTRFNTSDVLAAVVKKLTDPDTGPLAPAQASIGGQFLASPLYETVQDVPGVISLQSASLSLVFPEPDISIDANLGADHVVCVPAGTYFDFVGPDAQITTSVAVSQGAASASREKGC
jgi:predicted phage baseplate assembly protein